MVMEPLDEIGERIRAHFELQNDLRDKAINQSRALTRQSALSIRAIHRKEWADARAQLDAVQQSAQGIKHLLAGQPDLYYAGYTQDALKEYVEAFLLYAMIRNEPLPSFETLDVIPSTYINGLAEAGTELRRTLLDILRKGEDAEAERMLDAMDSIYTLLVTMDFPDAVTNGLRRRTDTVRGVLERTRGDLTLSTEQRSLERALKALAQRLETDS
jgi:translin